MSRRCRCRRRSGTMPHARLTAAPPLDPPQVFVRSYGFLVAPNTGLNVCDPAPNSGVLVLPTAIAPARLMRSTRIASFASGTLSLKIGEPNVVRMPAVSTRSLCATGRPCSGPSGAPRACASSALRAFSRACSAISVTIAFTFGFTRSICFRCASITSRALNFLRRMSAAISTAVRKQMSEVGGQQRRSGRSAENLTGLPARVMG